MSWSRSVPSCGASAMPMLASVLVAAETRDQVGIPYAVANARGHALQEFVADMMPEGIVDAFEFVDIDVEQGELLAVSRFLQLALDLLAEQCAVRQVGEGVIVRHMRDLVVG